ncbi:hypothetical protein MJO28_006586 [Puccinia striiformis f. sp. tritici]|uniref:Uncharacterized protein n=1 Tax=Puccinia striiformis f. sp. tritici TaxID=168172 RepID=A0ACC0EIV1_9BASI|nr:hypothetical protein MJO28_006586 [Puccinia striiformis f. sp. tritici]
MIGPLIIVILCHSAYLNIFTVILNAPAGVVAPSPIIVKGVESVAHDSSGVIFAGSQKLVEGEDLSRPASGKGFESVVHESSGVNPADSRNLVGGGEGLGRSDAKGEVKVSDEETLVGLMETRQNEVIKAKEDMKRNGPRKAESKYADSNGLEKLAIIKTALKERRLEEGWFSFSNMYRMIFKNSQWKQDRLYLKLKNLRDFSPIERVEPLEAQWAIRRLSFLEYRGFDFSKEEGQLIEKLSKQVKQMVPSQEKIKFELSKEDKELIDNIAWERVVQRKIQEIGPKIEVFKRIAHAGDGNGYAHDINDVLKAMINIISADNAQWSPQMTRLLNKIKSLKTDGDQADLRLSGKNEKAMKEVFATNFRISLEPEMKQIEMAAAAEDSARQAAEDSARQAAEDSARQAAKEA